MSNIDVHFVLIDRYKTLIFKSINNGKKNYYDVLWSDREIPLAPKKISKVLDRYCDYDEDHVEHIIKERLLERLFNQLFLLIERGSCNKIIVLVTMETTDSFRKALPRELAEKIVLQISRDYSGFTLKDIEKKVLNQFM